jgi:hypothetical protein
VSVTPKFKSRDWIISGEEESHNKEWGALVTAVAIGGPDVSPESVESALELHREKWGCDCGEDHGPR